MTQPAPNQRVILVTAPDLDTARRLIAGVLEAHLAACANIVPGIESHYWWEGTLESATECLILFKTHASRQAALETKIHELHPYDVPECIALDIHSGSAAYLRWINESCRIDTSATP